MDDCCSRELRCFSYALGIICLLSASLVNAQVNVQDACHDILDGGIFDSIRNDWSYSYEYLEDRSVCSSSDEKLRTSLTVPIKGVVIGGSFDRDKVKTACNNLKKQVSLSEIDKSVISQASAVIVGAWKECLAMRSLGPRFTLEQTGDGAIVHGYLSNETDGIGLSELEGVITIPDQLGSCKCDSLAIGDCKVQGDVIALRLPLNLQAHFSCKRKSRDRIDILPSFTQRKVSRATLPSINPPRLIQTSEAVDSVGLCDPKKVGGDMAFSFRAEELPRESLTAILRNSSATLSESGSSIDLYKDCDTKKSFCTFVVSEPILLAGKVQQQDTYGLWLDVANESFHLIAQRGNRDCPKGFMKTPTITIRVDRVNRWPLSGA